MGGTRAPARGNNGGSRSHYGPSSTSSRVLARRQVSRLPTLSRPQLREQQHVSARSASSLIGVPSNGPQPRRRRQSLGRLPSAAGSRHQMHSASVSRRSRQQNAQLRSHSGLASRAPTPSRRQIAPQRSHSGLASPPVGSRHQMQSAGRSALRTPVHPAGDVGGRREKRGKRRLKSSEKRPVPPVSG